MKIAKSILMGTLAVVLAGFLLALVAPKTVHALAATLVQVTNTPANPVNNQDVDSPGRSPYSQTVSCFSPTTNECDFLFPVVPANTRLVVQFIASTLSTSSTTPISIAEFVDDGNYIPILHTLQSTDQYGNLTYVANQPMLYYFEAGHQPNLIMFARTGGSPFMSGSVTLTGHLVNLTE